MWRSGRRTLLYENEKLIVGYLGGNGASLGGGGRGPEDSIRRPRVLPFVEVIRVPAGAPLPFGPVVCFRHDKTR